MIYHHRVKNDPKSKSHLEINLDSRERFFYSGIFIIKNDLGKEIFNNWFLPVVLMIVRKMVN
jgi:hypothetical protein